MNLIYKLGKLNYKSKFATGFFWNKSGRLLYWKSTGEYGQADFIVPWDTEICIDLQLRNKIKYNG